MRIPRIKKGCLARKVLGHLPDLATQMVANVLGSYSSQSGRSFWLGSLVPEERSEWYTVEAKESRCIRWDAYNLLGVFSAIIELSLMIMDKGCPRCG